MPSYSKNGGDYRPRFWRARQLTASCRPFSSRPWLLSWPCAYPSLRLGFLSRERSPAQYRCRPGTSACRPGPFASLRALPSEPCSGDRSSLPRPGGVQLKKRGCRVDTPVTAKRLALLAALLLSALCCFLRHYSSLELGSSALLPGPYGHHRWAERSTLIQDVDYG